MQAAVPSCAPDARRWSFEAVDPGELAALEVALVAAGGLGEEGAPQARKRRGVLQALVNTQAEPSAPEALLPRFCAPHLRVEVAATAAEVDAAVQQVYAAGVAVTGWDVEWPVSFVAGAKPKPIALMQFALPTAPPVCYLLHVAHSGITPALRALLEDAALRKVGVASVQDAQKVARDFNITCSGVLDLSELANRSLLPPMRWSLAALVARVLRCQLPKPAGIRIGAWDARTLGKEQLDYAALDAFASLRVWEELSALPPLLPAPAVAPPAFAHAPRSEETAAAASGWVPALSAPAALMHSKQETLRLHLAGMGVTHIAAARGIKDITVQNYLGDAIIAGHSYCWDLLGVERATADTIQAAAEATPPPVPAPSEDADTVLRGRMKQLKALLPEEVIFSHLRITLAHMQRTAAQAPDLSGAGPAQPAECVPASRV